MKTKTYKEAAQTQDYVARLKAELIKRKQTQVSLGSGSSLSHKDAGEQLKNTQARLSAAMAEGEVIQFGKRLEKKQSSGKSAAVHTFRSKDTKRNMESKLRLKKLANEETEMTISESVRQIVDQTVSGEPASVKTAVETAIGEKIATALETKKIQIAQNLIGIGESSDEEEPSWSHKGEKTDRAKRLAMNKIKKQAKDEGVELSDEDAELILEAVLDEKISSATLYAAKGKNAKATAITIALKKKREAAKKKVTKEAVDHITTWFSEEELNTVIEDMISEDEFGVFGCNGRKGSSASNEKVNVFGSEHKGTSGIPSELKRSGKDIMSQSKKKVSEASILMHGASQEAKARDIEQSDREYIKQNKVKAAYKVKHGNWPGWAKADTKEFEKNEDSQPTNGGPSLGLTTSPNRATAPKSKFPTKAQSNPNEKDAIKYDGGNKKPGDIMSKTEQVEALQQSFLEEFEIELTDEEAGLILEDILNVEQLDEASPPGWQHVVKKLLTKKDSKVNPWAIAWSMKNKGYHANPENQITRKSYERWYKQTGKGLAHAGT